MISFNDINFQWETVISRNTSRLVIVVNNISDPDTDLKEEIAHNLRMDIIARFGQ